MPGDVIQFPMVSPVESTVAMRCDWCPPADDPDWQAIEHIASQRMQMFADLNQSMKSEEEFRVELERYIFRMELDSDLAIYAKTKVPVPMDQATSMSRSASGIEESKWAAWRIFRDRVVGDSRSALLLLQERRREVVEQFAADLFSGRSLGPFCDPTRRAAIWRDRECVLKPQAFKLF